jgi:hypothetical protein
MIRELIDTEVEAVVGGIFDLGAVFQNIDAHQYAAANANGGFFGNGGSAVSLNVGGTNTNLSQIGG